MSLQGKVLKTVEDIWFACVKFAQVLEPSFQRYFPFLTLDILLPFRDYDDSSGSKYIGNVCFEVCNTGESKNKF
jgi:hypothetical protein